MNDGEIRISTKVDNTGITTGLKGTEKQIASLTNQFGKQVDIIRKQENALANLRDKIIDYLVKEYDNAIVKIEETNKKIALSKEFGDITGLAQAEQELSNLDAISIRLATRLGDIEEGGIKASEAIKEIIISPDTPTNIVKLAREANYTADNLERSKDKANDLKDTINKISNVPIKDITNETKKMSKETRNSTNAFEKFFKKITRLAAAVFVFNIIRKSLTEFKNYIGIALKENDAFAKSFAQVKGNLLIAFQPIIDTVIPIIATLVQWLSKATAQLAIFTNMLFSKSIKASTASAKALYSQAKALRNVNKQARSAANTLDELAFVSKETTKEDTVIEPIFKIPEPDESIFDVFDGIGKRLAKIFNKLVDYIDWKLLAKNISKGLIKVINELTSFLKNVDWKNIGKSIGDFILNIDWFGLGLSIINLMVSGMLAIGDLLIGVGDAILEWIGDPNFIENMFQSGVNLISSLISGTLSRIAKFGEVFLKIVEIFEELLGIKEWIKFGKDIMKGLSDGISSLLNPVADIFNNLSNKIFNTFKNLLTGIKEIWNGLSTWFNNTVIKPISNFFGSLWSGIKTGASTLADFIKSFVIDPIVNLFKGLYNSLVGIIEGVINAFIGIINAFIKGLNKAIDTINKIPGVNLKTISTVDKVKVPRLATGAVLPGGEPFMAIVNDQPRGQMNVETPISVIEDAVRKAMAEAKLNNNNEETNRLLELLIRVVESKNLQIGDRDIAEANSRGQRNIGIQTGGGAFADAR